MAEELDYYALLEVASDADEATLRLAYRRLARRYHPDVAGTGSLARMQRLNVAYQTLSNPEQRRLYDLQRQPNGPTQVQAGRPPTATPRPPDAARADQPSGKRESIRGSVPGPLQRVARLETRDTTPVAALAFARQGQIAGVGLLDGRVLIWSVSDGRVLTTLSYAPLSSAGVLQELRLSPGGTLAAAWGFQLGTRVWQVADGRALWNTGLNAPSGTMDAVLLDDPPLVRLALPDAPISLADEDPFRWAHEGQGGTAVLSRPLRGRVDPAWAIPRRSTEPGGAGIFGNAHNATWRVQLRTLSADGRLLFTYATGATNRIATARTLHLWELDHRTLRGAAQPRRIAQVAEPLNDLGFPVATTPDLAWIATTFQGSQVHLFAPANGDRRVVRTGYVPEDARAVLSSDGSYLAIARDNQLDLWQTRDGRHVQQWQWLAEVTTLAFVPASNRSLLAIGLRNGLVEIWG